MLAAACRPALAPMEADDGRRRRRSGDHGGGGRDVEGAGIADPSGRACGHDSGHADAAWAALGAPASRMLTMTMTEPMAMAMALVINADRGCLPWGQ